MALENDNIFVEILIGHLKKYQVLVLTGEYYKRLFVINTVASVLQKLSTYLIPSTTKNNAIVLFLLTLINSHNPHDKLIT